MHRLSNWMVCQIAVPVSPGCTVFSTRDQSMIWKGMGVIFQSACGGQDGEKRSSWYPRVICLVIDNNRPINIENRS